MGPHLSGKVWRSLKRLGMPIPDRNGPSEIFSNVGLARMQCRSEAPIAIGHNWNACYVANAGFCRLARTLPLKEKPTLTPGGWFFCKS